MKYKYLKGSEADFNGAFTDKEYAIKKNSDGRIFFPDNVIDVNFDLYDLIGQRQLIDEEQDINDCIDALDSAIQGIPLRDIDGAAAIEYPGVEELITERGNRYGKFKDGADIMQSLKDTMRDVDGWNNLTASQKEALDMIQHKIGRILNGDPTYDDSWKDIAGYATLIVNELNGEVK